MVVGKMKVLYRGIPINNFVGLKSKMHSILSDDGKESNTAKGVNIATEFNEFKDTLYLIKSTQTQNEKNSREKAKDWNIRNHQNINIVFWWQKICFRRRDLYTYLFSKRLKKMDCYRWS